MAVNRAQRRVRRARDTAFAIAVRNFTVALATDIVPVDSFADIVHIHLFNLTGAGITLTSTPNIRPGRFDGQILKLTVEQGGNNVIFRDESVLVGSNLRLSAAADKTVGPRDQMELIWQSTIAFWVQSGTLIAA